MADQVEFWSTIGFVVSCLAVIRDLLGPQRFGGVVIGTSNRVPK